MLSASIPELPIIHFDYFSRMLHSSVSSEITDAAIEITTGIHHTRKERMEEK